MKNTSIEEGDVIGTAKSLAFSDMLKTLNRSNDNLVVITQDLKEITHKLNTSPLLDKLLSDEALVTDLNQTARSLKTAGLQLQASTADVNSIVSDVKTGKRNIGVLLRDSSLAPQPRNEQVPFTDTCFKYFAWSTNQASVQLAAQAEACATNASLNLRQFTYSLA